MESEDFLKNNETGNKEQLNFEEMMNILISKNIIPDSKGKELLSKPREEKTAFLDKWIELIDLITERLVALEKLKDDPDLLDQDRKDILDKLEVIYKISEKLPK